MPKVKVLVAEVQEWVGWFNSLDQAQKEMIVTIGLVVAAIGPLLIILGQVATGIGSILTLISQISPLLSALGGPGGRFAYHRSIRYGIRGGIHHRER